MPLAGSRILSPDASVIRLMPHVRPNSIHASLRCDRLKCKSIRSGSLTDTGEAFGEAFLVFVGGVFEESIPVERMRQE